jgi:hypothetical protein
MPEKRSETTTRPRRTGEKEILLRLTLRGNKLRCADAAITCDDLSNDQRALEFGEALAGYLQGYFYEY